MLWQLGENSVHFFSGERSHCLRPDVAPGADGQADRGHRCVVRRFKYSNDIEASERPVKLLHGDAEFFCKLLDGVGPLGRVFGGTDALIRKAREDM